MSVAEDMILLKDQLKLFVPLAQKASQLIEDENISNYPIIVVHQQEIEIGIPIDIEVALPGNWILNASTLEEFVTKEIIEKHKIDDFRTLYRQHENHVCFFVLSRLGAQFIFFEKN